MRPWFDDHTLWSDDTRTQAKTCDHPGCAASGEHRAPKSPHAINDYYWFCQPHARAWNEGWDFAKGLGPDQIEDLIRFDVSWQRETWPLGSWRLKEKLFAKAKEYRTGHEGPSMTEDTKAPPEVRKALARFELTFPVTPESLRSKYLALVKIYHPDANGGDKKAENRLKDINHAYSVLRTFLQSSV